MIRDATAADGPFILQAVRRSACTGARIEVDWTIAMQNPAVPYRFYLLGAAQPCVLAVNTHAALLAGTPRDGEELALFLSFTDVARLFSDGWSPPGWKREAFWRMRKPPAGEEPDGDRSPATGGPYSNLNIVWDAAPAVEDVLAVLESTDGRILPPAARERLYVDLQIRRNHGCAEVYGIRDGNPPVGSGRLLSTAGVWALTPGEAYIACVETRPEARRRGYAHALVRALATRFASRACTLICGEELCGFYEPLGFARLDQGGIMSAPARQSK